MYPMLVLYYSRSYASVYDIKENAHMLYWKSVALVLTQWSEARTQGKDEMIFKITILHNTCTGHCILKSLLLDRETGLLEQRFA